MIEIYFWKTWLRDWVFFVLFYRPGFVVLFRDKLLAQERGAKKKPDTFVRYILLPANAGT